MTRGIVVGAEQSVHIIYKAAIREPSQAAPTHSFVIGAETTGSCTTAHFIFLS